MAIDFDGARGAVSLPDTVSRYVDLTAAGNEWKGCCPFHHEKTPSFTIFTGHDRRERFHCYGCGASGDVVDFVARVNDESVADAAKRITEGRLPAIPEGKPAPLPAASNPPEEWEPLPPDTAGRPDFDPARVWNHRKRKFADYTRAARMDCYRRADGVPICYVARFDHQNASKTIVVVSYCQHQDGRREWVTERPARPWPLFGLDAIAQRPDAPILIFEGEKKRALAEPLLPAYICTSLLGGTAGAGYTDFAPLAGRSVVLWPDANLPGRRCMDRVARELAGKVGALSLVDTSSMPEGHDAADLIAAGVDLADWLEWRVGEYVAPVRAAPAPPAPKPEKPRAALPPAPPPAPVAPTGSNVTPLRKPKPEPEIDEGIPPEYSDDHLAQRFATQFSEQFCFVNELQTWMVWTDGNRWTPDKTLLTRETIRTRICRAAANEAANRIELKAKGASIASALGSARATAAVDILSRGDRRMAVTTEQFDSDQWMLNTPGGIVDLTTGKTRPARHTDYCTKMTRAAPGGKCDAWLRFLDECCRGDATMVEFLQRWFGYCLTGSVREQKFVFLHGPGGSGKSTVLEIIRYVLNDYAQTTPMDTFMKKTKDGGVPVDLAEMRSSRFITAEEITEGRSWDEAKLKMCTGDVTIKARFMRQNLFEFAPTFKLTFAGNNLPQLDNVDDAMKRRFVMLPFLNAVKDAARDELLRDKLKTEAPGILAWMLQGCLLWQKVGLRTPETVITATESYFGDQDVIEQFVVDRLDLSDPGAKVVAAVVYEAYRKWCESIGEYPRDMRRFIEAVTKHGVTRGPRTTATVNGKRASGIIQLCGLRLKLPAEIDRDRTGDWK